MMAVKVKVSAVRPDGDNLSFHRGGHGFPTKGRVVLVEKDLLDVLKKEKMLHVELDPEDDVEPGEPLKLKSNRLVGANPAILAAGEKAALMKELSDLKLADENAKLRAEIEALKAKVETKAEGKAAEAEPKDKKAK